jgi:hypothetical protein
MDNLPLVSRYEQMAGGKEKTGEDIQVTFTAMR